MHQADAVPAPFCGAVDVIPSWAFSMPWEEKVIELNGFRTWVRIVGKGSEGGGLFSFLNKGSVKKYAFNPWTPQVIRHVLGMRQETSEPVIIEDK